MACERAEIVSPLDRIEQRYLFEGWPARLARPSRQLSLSRKGDTMQPVFVKVVLFDPVSEDPSLGQGTQVFDGLTVEIARIEPYRPERADRVLRLDPDPASRLFVARSPRYAASREHFFRVGFKNRNFSKVTRTLLAEGEVTPDLCPISSPARLPYWDSGWDDGYSTNEFFGDGDIITPSTPERPITLAIPLRRIYNIGHRGAPYRFPENTMASFRTALDLGANGLEFDICLTRDRHLTIFHDPSPDPTRIWYEDFPYELVSPEIDGETAVIREFRDGDYRVASRRKMRSGSSFDIMKLSFEQVRRFYRYHHVGGQEQPIPDLDEFLTFAAGEVHRLELLFFDMKSPPWNESREARKFRAYGELVGETIHRYPTLPERLVIGNASEAVLRELKAGILSTGETRCEFAYDASGGFFAMVGMGANPLEVARTMGNSIVSVGARFRWGDLEEITEAARDRDYNPKSKLSTVIHWTINDPAQDRPDVLAALLEKNHVVWGCSRTSS
jgi:glycerophosphoryl diester phosphodiesterase